MSVHNNQGPYGDNNFNFSDFLNSNTEPVRIEEDEICFSQPFYDEDIESLIIETEQNKIISELPADKFVLSNNSFPKQGRKRKIDDTGSMANMQNLKHAKTIPDSMIQSFRLNLRKLSKRKLQEMINKLKLEVFEKTKEIEKLKTTNKQWENICQEHNGERMAETERCKFFKSELSEKTIEIERLKSINKQLENHSQRYYDERIAETGRLRFFESELSEKTIEIEKLKTINKQWENLSQRYYDERIAETGRCMVLKSNVSEKTNEIEKLNNSNIQLQNELQRKSTDLKVQAEITELKLKGLEKSQYITKLEEALLPYQKYLNQLSSQPMYFTP